MSWGNNPRVLAIGIDAGEPALIRPMIEQNELPVLKSLLAEGRWLRVKSPSHIGSGSVWPSFITGEGPAKHGVYGEWCWQPEMMGLRRYTGRGLKAFWQSLSQEGLRVGILDVPFAPFLDLADGFEISEWGAHDFLEGRLKVAPSTVTDFVAKRVSHPLSFDRLDSQGPRDSDGLHRLSSGCLEGVRLRGALAQGLLAMTEPHLSLIVFTEIHHAGHYLWHTLFPDDPLYKQEFFEKLPAVEPGLKDIYREVDRQIGDLVKAVGPNTTVFVFSLHGMRPAHGIPSFLQPLLCELGYSRRASLASQSWTERAIGLMAAAKRHSPKVLKKAYYQTLPHATTVRLARPTMITAYDWERTRAFALPTDQHGWVRVNLKGREKKGIVTLQEYEQTCQELEQRLRALRTAEGRPIVREIFRMATVVEDTLTHRLPDLVVHWEDAVFSTPLKINGSGIENEPVGTKFTGQHALEGFCILRGADGLYENETLPATEMHRLITRVLKGC